MLKRISLLLVLSFIFQFTYSQKLNTNEGLFNNISEKNKDEINLLLSEFLDGAGLYTILGDLKPISSIQLKSLSSYYKEIPRNANEAEQLKKIVIKKVEEISPLLEEMSNDQLYFRVLPIQSNLPFPNIDYEITLMPEILILRKDLVYKTIMRYDSFFHSINIDTGSNYIANIEAFLFEYSTNNREARARAFGYLFGYPEYAVDFFVNRLNKINSENNTTVLRTPVNDRTFYQIPIYGNGSKYIYAIPKESKNRKDDIELTTKAKKILEMYTQKRKFYVQDSTLNAILLIQDWDNEEIPAANKM